MGEWINDEGREHTTSTDSLNGEDEFLTLRAANNITTIVNILFGCEFDVNWEFHACGYFSGLQGVGLDSDHLKVGGIDFFDANFPSHLIF